MDDFLHRTVSWWRQETLWVRLRHVLLLLALLAMLVWSFFWLLSARQDKNPPLPTASISVSTTPPSTKPKPVASTSTTMVPPPAGPCADAYTKAMASSARLATGVAPGTTSTLAKEALSQAPDVTKACTGDTAAYAKSWRTNIGTQLIASLSTAKHLPTDLDGCTTATQAVSASITASTPAGFTAWDTLGQNVDEVLSTCALPAQQAIFSRLATWAKS